MEKIFKLAMMIHVAAGVCSLLFGFIAAAARKKGGKLHNLTGQIYFWSMATIFITTTMFFIMKPAMLKYQFFLGIAIVSFYPCWSGVRMLSKKKAMVAAPIDLAAMWGLLIAGFVMIGYGVYGLFNPSKLEGIEYLFLIFGNVALANFYGDYKVYIKGKYLEKMHWFFSHGGKMLGSYGAALTAFCVNIVPRFLPADTSMYVFILTWTMPATLASIATYFILKKYRVQFGVK